MSQVCPGQHPRRKPHLDWEETCNLTIGYAEVIGGPAALLFAGGELLGILVMDLTEQGDRRRDLQRGIPDKLTWLAATLPARP